MLKTTKINDNQLIKLLKLAIDNFLDFKNKYLESFEKLLVLERIVILTSPEKI